MQILRALVPAAACGLCITYPFSAAADISLRQYSEFRKNVSQFKDYLVGVGRGVFWANVILETNGKPKLFCMPRKLALDEEIILSMLEQEIRSPSGGKPYSEDAPVEMVMTFSFAHRFPCPLNERSGK